MTNHFADRLVDSIREKQSPVVVGLDPNIDLIPQALRRKALDDYGDSIEGACQCIADFNRAIIDAVCDIVPAIKPQSAYYEQYGPRGLQILINTISYAKSKGLMVILDVKRSDIAATCEAYANAYLGSIPLLDHVPENLYKVDAITINPYMGLDSIEPFLTHLKDKGIFVLLKTSNPSSKDIQDLKLHDGKTVVTHLAEQLHQLSQDHCGQSGYSSLGVVVGATYPEELATLRTRLPHSIFLVPGFGSQGGTAQSIQGAFNDDGYGALINASRSLLYAYKKEPYSSSYGEEKFAQATRAATLDMIEAINKIKN